MFDTVDQILDLPSLTWNDRRLLPESPGLYFVITDGQITYIGKTTRTLRKRWLYRSDDLPKFRYFGEFWITFAVITDFELLDRLERDLLRRFRPPLNGYCVPNQYRNLSREWPFLRWDRPWLPPAPPA